MNDANIEKIRSHIHTARVYLGNVPDSLNVIEILNEADRVLDSAMDGTVAKAAALADVEAFLEDACHELDMIANAAAPVDGQEGALSPDPPHVDAGVENALNELISAVGLMDD